MERPVLVTVHGGPGLDHMTVKSALEPLAADFQVLYFDLRATPPAEPRRRGTAERPSFSLGSIPGIYRNPLGKRRSVREWFESVGRGES